jgi:hypothetical protein
LDSLLLLLFIYFFLAGLEAFVVFFAAAPQRLGAHPFVFAAAVLAIVFTSLPSQTSVF